MSNYAILRRAKLKTSKQLTDSYKHNVRIYDVENADPLKRDDNIEYIDTHGMSYEELVEFTVTELKTQGVPDRTIRKDAVKGFEVILTFSREQEGNINLDDWVQKNLDWLDKKFNPPGHQASFIDSETGQQKTVEVNNLKHAILHLDESKPHLHVFIVPIDDRGNLNASYYDQGRNYLQALQTEYAKEMEEFGLVRGEEHSTATPEQMSRYYNNIVKAVEAELPEPLPGESLQDYRIRANETYQIALSNHRNEIVKMNQELIHVRSDAGKQVFSLRNEITEEKALLSKLVDETNKHLQTKDEGIERERTIVNAAVENLNFKEAIQKYPNQEDSSELLFQYNQMLLWYEEFQREETERKKKEERDSSDER